MYVKSLFLPTARQTEKKKIKQKKNIKQKGRNI